MLFFWTFKEKETWKFYSAVFNMIIFTVIKITQNKNGGIRSSLQLTMDTVCLKPKIRFMWFKTLNCHDISYEKLWACLCISSRQSSKTRLNLAVTVLNTLVTSRMERLKSTQFKGLERVELLPLIWNCISLDCFLHLKSHSECRGVGPSDHSRGASEHHRGPSPQAPPWRRACLRHSSLQILVLCY